MLTLFYDMEYEPKRLTTPSSDFLKEMVPVGFDPATFGSHVQHSYHLSHGTATHWHCSLVSVQIFPSDLSATHLVCGAFAIELGILGI